jgi:hypothetical protein
VTRALQGCNLSDATTAQNCRQSMAGKELWSYRMGLPLKSWPAASGNTLHVSDYDGNLRAFVSRGR